MDDDNWSTKLALSIDGLMHGAWEESFTKAEYRRFRKWALRTFNDTTNVREIKYFGIRKRVWGRYLPWPRCWSLFLAFNLVSVSFDHIVCESTGVFIPEDDRGPDRNKIPEELEGMPIFEW